MKRKEKTRRESMEEDQTRKGKEKERGSRDTTVDCKEVDAMKTRKTKTKIARIKHGETEKAWSKKRK